jgi:hypothetical protein
MFLALSQRGGAGGHHASAITTREWQWGRNAQVTAAEYRDCALFHSASKRGQQGNQAVLLIATLFGLTLTPSRVVF